MNVVYGRCCGLDIHKNLILACLFVPAAGDTPRKEVRSFGTMTDDLLSLSDWLVTNEVTHVAMESTGVYWKPIYNILEGDFTLLLVNAQHIKMVPGRKSDVQDCEWIAELLRHGLLQGSFVPDRPQRELRELTRYRISLIRERASEVNRLQKVLEGANIKLGSVASNVMGKSARQMIELLAEGVTDTAFMADLARGALRGKIPQLERALHGHFASHQRFMVAQQLAHIDFLEEAIGQVSMEVKERMRPLQVAIDLLDSIPGVSRRSAEQILAETGADMSRFPSAGHLASWAGMSPGNNESAGKRHSGHTRKGNKTLRVTLVEAAQAAAHTKGTYLKAQYHRLAPRRGKKRAMVAVGHTILVIAYHVLTNNMTYQELGGNYFDARDREATEHRLVRRLEAMGNKVTLEPITNAA